MSCVSYQRKKGRLTVDVSLPDRFCLSGWPLHNQRRDRVSVRVPTYDDTRLYFFLFFFFTPGVIYRADELYN